MKMRKTALLAAVLAAVIGLVLAGIPKKRGRKIFLTG